MHTILSSSVAVDNSAPVADVQRRPSVVGDHLRRVLRAFAGFRVFGWDWLSPWLAYIFWPALKRCLGRRVIRFKRFHVRADTCDLETFGGLFEDYPPDLVQRALRDVDLVVDLGANVGAFSCLVQTLCAAQNRSRPIRAVEPSSDAIVFLREQPFASAIDIRQVAVGANKRSARLVSGKNSVSGYVDLSENGDGEPVDVVTLRSLCDRPALVKIDIEGAEWEILESGLPEVVRHLFLEWHPRLGQSRTPPDFLPGHWQLLSQDPYGASTWYFHQ